MKREKIEAAYPPRKRQAKQRSPAQEDRKRKEVFGRSARQEKGEKEKNCTRFPSGGGGGGGTRKKFNPNETAREKKPPLSPWIGEDACKSAVLHVRVESGGGEKGGPAIDG